MVSMVNKMIRLIILVILLLPSLAWSTPSVSGVSGTVNHGSPLVISGSGFGVKSPAKPLIWDDGTGQSDGTYITTSFPNNSDSRLNYSDVEPPVSVSATHRMRYRATPYTPYGASGYLAAVPAPYSHVSVIMSGGHEDGVGSDTNDGANIWLTIPSTSGRGSFASDWTAYWYYRCSNEWGTPGPQANHKFLVLQSDVIVWGSPPYANQFLYFDYSSRTPAHRLGYIEVEAQHNNATIISVDHLGVMPDTNNPWDKIMGLRANAENNTALNAWIHYSTRVSNDDGFVEIKIDNEPAWWGTGIPNFFTDAAEWNYPGIGSISVGSYHRQDNIYPNPEDDNAHVFLAAVYVDDSLAHVILANNQTLANATIVEPQIPSAWATGEITVKLNQGSLPDGAAYLFVYDPDGAVNATGYEVTFGTVPADETAPVVEISTTNPSSITADELTLTWTDSDNVAVTERRYRIGAQPTPSTGTAATSPVQVTGFSIGTNTLYVGARDAAGNWGYASIVVVYTEPAPESAGAVITLSGSGATITLRANGGALFQLLP